MKQSTMDFSESPDLTQEQRRLLQAWLKIIKRKLPIEKPKQIGFIKWALRKAKAELTPCNYAYFEPIARKALTKALKGYERHILAERSIQNGGKPNSSTLSTLQETSALASPKV